MTNIQTAAEKALIELRSEAFEDGQPIPRRYAYEGDNVSPPLSWSNLPDRAKELVLICDDPDAPRDQPFVHWVVYKIPPTARGLGEGLPRAGELESPAGVWQGKNDFGEVGYGGPLPPEGHGIHHYHFKLYALDDRLSLDQPGATKEELLRAMRGQVIGGGELVGTYRRD